MKKLLLIAGLYLTVLNAQAQTDRYWKGYGGSDDISDGGNWFSGNPSSGDNLYFNNTGGDCGNTGRRNAYSNYGAGSYFGNLIVYNCAKGIKFYGNNSYFKKIENSNSPDLLEVANATIGSRSGFNIEINPVGTGGLLISSSVVTIDNTTSSKSILIYGSQSLTINSAIGDVNGTGGQIQIMGSSTVTLSGSANNTYSGNTTTFNGGGLLILNKSSGIKAIGNNLVISNGSTVRTDGDNQFGSGTPALVTINGNGIFNGNGRIQKIALASSSSTSSVIMGAGALIIDNTGNDVFDGIISGVGATVTKSNSGIQTLRGGNLYTGLTTVNAGTLCLNRTGGTTIPTTNHVIVNASGILQISANQTLSSLVNNGMVIIDPGVTVTVGSITGSGTIKGSATSNLVVTGTGSILNFDQTSAATRSLNNLTLSVNTASATLGNALDVYGNIDLNDGSLNMAGMAVTLKSNPTHTATIDQLLADGSNLTGANNVTAERFIKLRGTTNGTGTSNGGRAYRVLGSTVTTSTSINANWQNGEMNTAVGANVNASPGFGTQITGAGGNTNGFDVTASNTPSLYTFSPGSNILTNIGYPAVTNVTTGSVLDAKTGYFLYLRGDRATDMTEPYNPLGGMSTSSTTLRATGTVQKGTINYTISNTIGNFTLITNPYPAPLDWDAVYAANSANIVPFYTFWNSNTGIEGAFEVVAIASPTRRYIQPGQGFFVESTGGTTTVTINENMKAVGNNNNNGVYFTNTTYESFNVELYLTEANGSRHTADAVQVKYDNNSSAGADAGDANEINNWKENIAISRNGTRLAFESRPVIVSKDTIPLFMNKMRQSNYELVFTPSLFTNTVLKVELIDNFLNTRTLLSVIDSVAVPFTITSDPASSATDRFKIVFGQFGPLAIDMITISAQQKNSGVQVNWTAKTEKDMDRYELERSFNGTVFTRINTTAAIGNSPTAVNYSWLDVSPQPGNNFYRIKAIDRSGMIKYTDVVKVGFGKPVSSVTVTPNPVVGNVLTLKLNDVAKGNYSIVLYNNAGQQVYNTAVNHNGGSAVIPVSLNKSISQGIYRLVITGTDFNITEQIIKN